MVEVEGFVGVVLNYLQVNSALSLAFDANFKKISEASCVEGDDYQRDINRNAYNDFIFRDHPLNICNIVIRGRKE